MKRLPLDLSCVLVLPADPWVVESCNCPACLSRGLPVSANPPLPVALLTAHREGQVKMIAHLLTW